MSDQPVQTSAGAAAMALPFTVAQLILIAVFALLVIFGIIWGIRLKRRRVAVEETIEADREAGGVPPARGEPLTGTAPQAEPSVPPPPAKAPASAPLTEASDITRLKGLGPKLATTLADLGITRIDQIAAMSAEEMAALDARLGSFRGRPARDRWAEQARLLTVGDTAAYEAEFGKLGG